LKRRIGTGGVIRESEYFEVDNNGFFENAKIEYCCCYWDNGIGEYEIGK